MRSPARRPAEFTAPRPMADEFLEEVLHGLRQPQKTLPCKYFYDERGSRLFEEICRLEEYYLTRTELGIMRAHGREMAEALGPDCMIIEYGSASGTKIRPLLEHLRNPAAYVPVDISREHLLRAARELARDHPWLDVLPVHADFSQPFDLPPAKRRVARRVAFFPGSTIGNFTHKEAGEFLRRVARACGERGGLLIGVDLMKDAAILEAAYDDRSGVTRDFNLNILAHINRELGADFRLDRFLHRAFFRPELGRIEMHLVSTVAQIVRLGDAEIRFEKDESIHTENCHKYRLEDFAALAAEGGFEVEKVWTDGDRLFSVQYLRVRSG